MKKAFHVVFTLLAINFLVPDLAYALAPDRAIASFAALESFLGGPPLPHAEDSVFWRVMAVSNVATLGFCCVLLQVDLRRWYPVLVPLLFLKAGSAAGWAVAWASEGLPAYGAAAVFDTATVGAMWFFATMARRELPA